LGKSDLQCVYPYSCEFLQLVEHTKVCYMWSTALHTTESKQVYAAFVSSTSSLLISSVRVPEYRKAHSTCTVNTLHLKVNKG